MLDYKNKNALHPPAVIVLHQVPGTPSTITHSFHPLHDGDRYRIANAV